MPSEEGVRGLSARRERFVRVAARRTKKVLVDLQRLGKCSNRSGYDYSDADVSKIFGAIDKELDFIRAQFRSKARKEVDFSFE